MTAAVRRPAAGTEPALAPWGHRPTPLLPRCHRENRSELALPPDLADAVGALTVAGMARLWEQTADPLRPQAAQALLRFAGKSPMLPPPDLEVVGPGATSPGWACCR